MNKFYVLERKHHEKWGKVEYQIVGCPEDNNPLYGYGSWNLYSGPHNTWEDAEGNIPT